MTMVLMLCLLSVPYQQCGPATAYQIINVKTDLDRQSCIANVPYFETDPELTEKVGQGRYLRIMCTKSHKPLAMNAR